MYSGECLCGTVMYQVNTAISAIECCHCQTCRKAHSSAFAIGVTIDASSFQLVHGEDSLQAFESSNGKFRVFCKHCGSHIYAYRPQQPNTLRLRAATLNTDLNQFSIKHIYTENRINLD
ncbi:GFA family protein [Endozoicomonas sp. SM1973]|uniref:GFA family protein n=1 Tax=Spartinivicinus marinus TaxID=2994442 RepID=A0A853I236_9GAMM|nr:GFA family protein [Spartinivicinus marinus]MCX4028424.1 GFA family protein [Spartinivicinus marinus]NYZ67463.1 GFA family protein [Spartinivicinus marinus]